MADDYWQTLIAETVDWFQAEVDDRVKYIIDEVFPAFTIKAPPAERETAYNGLDWANLQQTSPHLWAKLSQDYLSIQAEKRDAQMKALQDWEHAQYTEASAFRPQLTPYGYTPDSPTAQVMGLSDSIPSVYGG